MSNESVARTPGALRAGPGQHLFDLGTVNHLMGGPAYSTANGSCIEGDRIDRKSTRLNSSHMSESRMPSSA